MVWVVLARRGLCDTRIHFMRSLNAIGGDGLALTVIILIRKKCLVYKAIALGLTVFMCMLLLDTAVVIRYLRITPHTSGNNLKQEFSRLFRKSGQRHIESIASIAVVFRYDSLDMGCLPQRSVWVPNDGLVGAHPCRAKLVWRDV